MRLFLERYSHEEKQTIGKLYLLRDDGSVINDWHSLELPWLDNQRNISCIPKGIYKAKKHVSPRFSNSLWIQDVPNRSEILIHLANYFNDLRGCIAIGVGLKDLNKDGHIDLFQSRKAINVLMLHLKDVDGIMLEIR